MSEENENAEAEAAIAGTDPAALAFALGAASREKADAYLAKQSRLAALLAENLEREEPFQLSHLRWRRFEDQMKGTTRLNLVAAGALLLSALGAALWQASQAEGLVVDAFSVPPAFPIFQELTRSGSKDDRPWAFIAWGLISEDQLGFAVERALLTRALGLNPGNILAWSTRARGEELEGRPERALRDLEKQNLLLANGQTMVRDEYVPVLRALSIGRTAALTGDFQEAVRQFEIGAATAIPGRLTMTGFLVRFHLGQHDRTRAQAAMANVIADTPLSPGSHDLSLVLARMRIAGAAEDWAGVQSYAKEAAPVWRKYPGQEAYWPTTGLLLVAHAQARLGNMAAAEGLIRATPEDCYGCLLERAHLAEMRSEKAQADGWFDRAVRSNPSIPVAESEWGRALLARGKPDAAIKKFKLASQKGPRFADPLEGWGEALMAKNQSHLALAKFEEANKYAPNWGRLHLKWGQALAYAGKKDEAKKQFARAAALDLSPSEKSDLAKWVATGA